MTFRYLFQKYDFLLTQSDFVVSIDVSTGNQPGENTENTMKTLTNHQAAARIEGTIINDCVVYYDAAIEFARR